MNAKKPSHSRRGVLLLIVLALLAMFGLFAITFVIIAGQSRQSASQGLRVGQYHDPQEDLLYQAMLQGLRGSRNPASVLQTHSLLETMYGEVPEDTNPIPGINNRFIRQNYRGAIPLPPATWNPGPDAAIKAGIVNIPAPDAAEAWHQVGNVLTMTSGAAKGLSTQILGFDGVNFHVLAFDKAKAAANDPVIGPGDTFVINGTPFSGTGSGYNPFFYAVNAPNDPVPKDIQNIMLSASVGGTPPTDTTNPNSYGVVTDFRYALLPNPVAFEPNAAIGYVDPAGPGGANSDYTAPDFQHMLLAGVDEAGNVRIPSLHRPELVNYWINKVGQAYWDSHPDLQRKVILRPLAADHPLFPAFKPLTGPWDVDNDGDGTPDSIWVDLGFPVRSGPDGKLYKPLVAILCVDLDGRLNVNAHGTYTQTLGPQPVQSATLYNSLGQLMQTNGLDIRNFSGLAGNRFADGTTSGTLRRGQGYGPAEINLAPLFQAGSAPNWTLYQRLLGGVVNGGTAVDGRYGESDLLAQSKVPAPGLTELPGVPADPYNPLTDPLAFNKFMNFPDNCLTSMVPQTMPGPRDTDYGSVPDLKGSMAVGLDLRGQPIYDALRDPAVNGPVVNDGGNPFNFARTNHPYELDLSGKRTRGLPNGSPDNPFSAAELETFLRMYDRDAMGLSSRLASLTGPDSSKPLQVLLNPTDPLQSLLVAHRHEFTPESWSVPSPRTAYPPWLSKKIIAELTKSRNPQAISRIFHPVDLLRAKLAQLKGESPAAPDPTLDQLVQTLAPVLLPPECLAGLRMNVNRPFGNGRDDNGNGVVDEPGEVDPTLGYEPYYYADAARNVGNTQGFGPGGFGLAARQAYAKHLYVMALLLMDEDYYPPWITNGDKDARARWLAQWAVNVVDFRDRDSIMTPFPYCVDPFTTTGWNPDRVVWGCERPELLITETLALHARRRTKKKSDPQKREQRLRPLGSLFVELCRPWSGVDGDSGEFSVDPTTGKKSGAVLLNRKTGGTVGDPVWRMIVVKGADYDKTPDDPASPLTIERSIYFTDPSSLNKRPIAEGKVRFYPSSDAKVPALGHNRYAVIGPGDDNYQNHTYITRSASVEPDPTLNDAYPLREIVLAQGGVQVPNNDDGTRAKVKPSVGVLIDQAQTVVDVNTKSPVDTRMSVSEPETGYKNAHPLSFQPYYSQTQGDYIYDAAEEPKDDDGLTVGLTAAHSVVHLQRLANPFEPYNQATNPYLTIDSAPVDLEVYEGWVQDNDDFTFRSRERGYRHFQDSKKSNRNLWKAEPKDPPSDDPRTASDPAWMFPRYLKQTLGYLNESIGQPIVDNANPEYLGDPLDGPFPWLNWNNRPFVSQMELMFVPWTNSWELLRRFDLDPDPTANANLTNWKPYEYNEVDQTKANAIAFPHLNNFFFAVPQGTASASNLYRLFDFLCVPSRFVGTETFGNPQLLTGTALAPPFNQIPTYREPGLLNLNTITSMNVFRGLLNRADLSDGGLWNLFLQSRCGIPGATNMWDTNAAMNAKMPTLFANPFRSYGGASLVPLTSMKTAIGNDENATLFRVNPTPPNDKPLFLPANPTASAVNDPTRNPYFRYQELQRLGNLVTTHSNVYAVWITVGYFEVTPNNCVDAGHKDGYQLGQELGSDTGEIKRHRAFFIIDRSIPVGFQRGKDLNVEKTILLKRYIE